MVICIKICRPLGRKVTRIVIRVDRCIRRVSYAGYQRRVVVSTVTVAVETVTAVTGGGEVVVAGTLLLQFIRVGDGEIVRGRRRRRSLEWVGVSGVIRVQCRWRRRRSGVRGREFTQ